MRVTKRSTILLGSQNSNHNCSEFGNFCPLLFFLKLLFYILIMIWIPVEARTLNLLLISYIWTLINLIIFLILLSDLIYDFLVTLSKRLTEVDVSTILTVLQGNKFTLKTCLSLLEWSVIQVFLLLYSCPMSVPYSREISTNYSWVARCC